MSQPWWPGQIGLVKSHSAVGTGVRFLQLLSTWTDRERAGWVHVITGLELGQIGEAQPGGYRVVDMHYPPADVWWVPDDRLPYGHPRPDQCAIITSTAHRMAKQDIGYSGLDYFSIGLHRLHIPAPHLRAFIKATGHQICSQAADYQYDQAEYHLFTDKRWEGDVPPIDLAVLFQAPQGLAKSPQYRRCLGSAGITGRVQPEPADLDGPGGGDILRYGPAQRGQASQPQHVRVPAAGLPRGCPGEIRVLGRDLDQCLRLDRDDVAVYGGGLGDACPQVPLADRLAGQLRPDRADGKAEVAGGRHDDADPVGVGQLPEQPHVQPRVAALADRGVFPLFRVIQRGPVGRVDGAVGEVVGERGSGPVPGDRGRDD